MSKETTSPAHEVGRGKIFVDLGLRNVEEHQLKAALVAQLRCLIKERKLTQIAAAKLVGIKQPDLSNVLRGHYRGYSVERLMRMLTAFDQDVEITMKPHKKAGEGGRITFFPVPS
jgi:predicted XRE-type DNA-binding protein